MVRWAGWAAAGLAIAGAGAAAAERVAIGIHESWGAFRDGERCYAVSEPAEQFRRGDRGPFLAILQAPGQGARGQIHVRLRFPKLRGAPVTLSIGERRFPLVAGGANAWARDAAQDAAIVAAMRSGTSLSVETRARDGHPFADVYRLKGAATAIDEAALGCIERDLHP